MRSAIVAVSIFLAAGSAGLAFLPTTVDVADAPKRLDATDLDGDGDIDLFVMADGAGQVASLQVLLNDGGDFSAGWSAVQSTGSSDLPWDIDLADTDSDGDADALYLIPSGGACQRFNDGFGVFGGIDFLPAFAGRAEQEPFDVDDDGDVDLVYYEEDIIGYFGTLKGAGDGDFGFDFSTETWFGLGSFDFARRFEIGDVTADGLPDAAMASKNGLQLIEGRPPAGSSTLPGWLDAVKLYPTACADVALVDLDGNALLDIVASVPSQDSVVVLLRRPSGEFAGPALFPAGPVPGAVAATDLDLDGSADVVVTSPLSNRIYVLRGPARHPRRVRVETRRPGVSEAPAGRPDEEEIETFERQVLVLQEEAEAARRAAEEEAERILQDVRVRVAMPSEVHLERVSPPELPEAPAAPGAAAVPPAPPPWKFWFETGTPEEKRPPETVIADVRGALVDALAAGGVRLAGLAGDERVTVTVDFVPGGMFAASARPERTLVVSVRVKDVDARARGAITSDELRKRVEVTEY